MTSRARATARALRETEAARRRRALARRARRRALLTGPLRAVRRLVLPRRGATGRLRTRRDWAQLAAVAVGLAVVLMVVFVTVSSWELRIGAAALALLVAPVLVTLSKPNRRLH